MAEDLAHSIIKASKMMEHTEQRNTLYGSLFRKKNSSFLYFSGLTTQSFKSGDPCVVYNKFAKFGWWAPKNEVQDFIMKFHENPDRYILLVLTKTVEN